MIKFLIFDMDNTLFDTYGQLGVKILDEMIRRLKNAGLTPEQEKVMREKYLFTGFRILARQLGLSEELKQIGMETYKSMDMSHITPYDDVFIIKQMEQKKALVTSGTPEVQLKKVEILKIGDLFGDVVVDESNTPENKQKIFEELLKKNHVGPKETMVIGDNPESELLAGKNIGLVTVQIHRREYIRGETDYHIKDLRELKKLVKDCNNL